MTGRHRCSSLALATALAAAGCAAPAAPAPAPVAMAAATPAGTGVIITMRAIAPPAGPSDVRTTILAAVGETRAAPTTAAYEFVVRADDGRTVTIVQADDAGLHPGERIALTPGRRTRLSRAE